MNIDDLEEALSEILPPGFSIEANKKGELLIYTGLKQDEDGELLDLNSESDEEDADFDPDFEPLEEDEDEDEDE